MKIAVLGAGNGGCATAADLALAGHRVRLWSRSADALGPLADNATITLEAEGRHGAARLERATTDLGEAVEGAEILIAPLPATSHEDLAKRLAPCLNDRQIVLLTPGSLGSYAMARAIARAGGTLPLALAETGTLPYLARKTAPAVVKAPVRAANLPIGVFPASRGPSVVPRLAELFPALRPRARALRVGRTGSRCSDARRHGAPPRVRRAARARADGRGPRARAPGARRLQPARDPRVPSGRVGLDGVAEGDPVNMRVLLPLLALAVLAGVPARAEQGVTDTEILLGGSNSLSGPLAFTGEQMTKFGVDLYLKVVNDAGGIHGRKVRTKWYDDGYRLREAQANTKKLVEQDRVFAIIAPQGTTPVVATLKYLGENKVPLLFPYQGSTVTRGRRWVVQGMMASDRMSKMMIDYLVSQRKYKKFAALYQDDEYGQSFRTSLAKDLARYGLKMVAAEPVNTGDTEVSAKGANLQGK